MKQILKTVSQSNQKQFEEECNALLAEGYALKSSDCGFCDSEICAFCESWMAIFIKEIEEQK